MAILTGLNLAMILMAGGAIKAAVHAGVRFKFLILTDMAGQTGTG